MTLPQKLSQLRAVAEKGKDGPRINGVCVEADYIAAFQPDECLALLDALELAVNSIRVECADKHGEDFTGRFSNCVSCRALASIEKRME